MRRGGDPQCFDEAAVGNAARAAVQVVDTVFPRVVTEDVDGVIGQDAEVPWLRVVAAGCPARFVENLFDQPGHVIFRLQQPERAGCGDRWRASVAG